MEGKEEEKEFLASIEDYKRFMKNNLVWRDMKMVLEGWVNEIYSALSDPKRVNDIGSLSDYQGRIYMCDEFLNFPKRAIEALEDNKYMKNLEEQEDGNSKKK